MSEHKALKALRERCTPEIKSICAHRLKAATNLEYGKLLDLRKDVLALLDRDAVFSDALGKISRFNLTPTWMAEFSDKALAKADELAEKLNESS